MTIYEINARRLTESDESHYQKMPRLKCENEAAELTRGSSLWQYPEIIFKNFRQICFAQVSYQTKTECPQY